ncbi:MAG: peptidyl-prolyl cis-trans isomerase [Deltaproteobacteria bacterium]|jgi:parvulin-like peptidyl-prolyl isomerase|nr:peptidyl-prolyl cis-trans isomerase [Deltaproteobacteria bacterium]
MKSRLLASLTIFTLLVFLTSLGVWGCSQNDPKNQDPTKPAPTKPEPTKPEPDQAWLDQPASQPGQPATTDQPLPPDSDQPPPPDRTILATVNDLPIEANVFYGQVRMRQTSDSFGNPENPENNLSAPLELRLEVLDQLFSLNLAHQEALKEGYTPKPEELVKIMDQVAESYGGGAEDLKNLLAKYGDSVERLQQQVAYNETIRKWRDTAFLAQALVSESEARAYYEANQKQAEHPEQVRALQIVFPVPLTTIGDQEKTRQAIKDKAQAAFKDAQAGLNFEDLIKKYMNPNTLSLTNNGQMGWVSQDGGFPILEEALFKLTPGQISEIVETDFSFHILKALERRPAGRLTFEDLKPDILDFLTNQKIDLAVRDRLTELRENAKIEILDPELAKAWPEFEERQKKLAEQLLSRSGDDLAASSDSLEADAKTYSEPVAQEATPPTNATAPSATPAQGR